MIKKHKAKCFSCDKPIVSTLTGVNEKSHEAPPLNALVFSSCGNYGSSVFDNYSVSNRIREKLEIIICDDCLKSKIDSVLFVVSKTETIVSEVRPFSEVIDKI